MAAAECASDLVEPLIGCPEVDAGNKGGGKQVSVDVANALAHELAGFDEIANFTVEAG